MLKNDNDGEDEPIQTEPVCKIRREIKKNVPSIPFIPVHCRDIHVVNYYTKCQFEVHTEKNAMRVRVTRFAANSYFYKKANKDLRACKKCASPLWPFLEI